MFKPETVLKIRLDAKRVKEELRGRLCTVVRAIGTKEPFHYLVKMSDGAERVFRGDEVDVHEKHA